MGYKNIEDRRAYHREYIKEHRRWMKEHHMCTECGKQDAYTLNGRTYCYECNEKHNERTQKQYHSEKVTQRVLECAKQRREKRAEQGICVNCGKRKAEHGKKQCSICLAKGRENKHQNNNTIPRHERFAYGLCYKCGNPLDGQINKDGSKSKLCTTCYSTYPKPPKTRVLHTPFCYTENSMKNWEKVLEKREELLANGTYDYIPIVNVMPKIKAGVYNG